MSFKLNSISIQENGMTDSVNVILQDEISNLQTQIYQVKKPPYKLLIYYGYPSQVNSLNSVTAAGQLFLEYDNIVFGDGLENSSHPDHENLVSIITFLKSKNPSIIICGYVDLGISTNNYSIQTMKTMVDNWKITGVNTIFLDDFGYDFLVTRERQNTMVSYIHSLGLSCFANAWNSDDIFSSTIVPIYNSTGLSTEMGPSDYFLLESFPYNYSSYMPNVWKPLVDLISVINKAQTYRTTFGSKICAISILDYTVLSENDRSLLRLIIQAIGFVLSIDYIGDSDVLFSSITNFVNKISPWSIYFPMFLSGPQDYFFTNPNILSRYDYYTTITYEPSTSVSFTSPNENKSI